MGAGERLAWFLRDRALYLGKERGWAWWDGKRWVVGLDAERLVTRYAHRSMRRMTAMALDVIEKALPDDERNAAWERTKKSAIANAGKVRTINNAITVAMVHPEVGEDPARMDADPYLINVQNGVLNIHTMELLPHHPKYRMTACSEYAWNPEADMSFWEEKVLEMMSGDAELVRFLQRAAGWTLLGEGTTRTQAYIHCYGISNSGKGVFTRTLLRVLGRSMACSISFGAIAEATKGAPNSDISQAEGKRYILCPDTGGSPRWDGEVLKQLTGGDVVACRELHRPKREFQPVGSLWICSNDKPMPRGSGKHAIFNRGKIVRFRQEYSQDPEKLRKGLALPMDPDLERTLHEEHGEAVLKWCVLGARSYLDTRTLGTCEALEREMNEYKEGAKAALEEFADEYLRTEYDDVDDGELAFEHDDWDTQFVTAEDLHKAFGVWCDMMNYKRGAEATPTKISRTLNGILDNVSRFKRVRKGQFATSIVKGSRGRAWKRLCWTREGANLLHRSYGTSNEREPF